MPLLPRLMSLWRNLFRKARKEQELTEEIDAYLEMLVDQKIEEGLDPAEARRAALIELGGKEQLKTLTAESGGEYWRPAVVSEFMLHRPDRLVSEVDSEYTLTYLSPKDKLDRPANIPEIHIARPGMSVFTRQAVKVKREAR
jgi:hypothetical protein